MSKIKQFMSILLLKQGDKRWGKIPLGFSKTTTIGSHGCVITNLAMISGLNPDDVNERLKKVNGYAQTNLIIWNKIKEAIPSLGFVWRNYTYEKKGVLEAIKKNDFCLVECMNGNRKHWVLFIGNGKLLDPLTGKSHSISKYKKYTGYCILKIKNKIMSKNTVSEETYKACMKDRTGFWKESVRLQQELEKLLKEKANDKSALRVKGLEGDARTLTAEHEKEIALMQQKHMQEVKDTVVKVQTRFESQLDDREDKISMLKERLLKQPLNLKARFTSRKFLLATSAALFDIILAVLILCKVEFDTTAMNGVLVALHTAITIFVGPEFYKDYQERKKLIN